MDTFLAVVTSEQVERFENSGKACDRFNELRKRGFEVLLTETDADESDEQLFELFNDMN